ncbi:MAG: hypothetical protein VX210_02950 [Myxococcota bacterium]|nr:hypothetical protein [Myxococcota bacterium]
MRLAVETRDVVETRCRVERASVREGCRDLIEIRVFQKWSEKEKASP